MIEDILIFCREGLRKRYDERMTSQDILSLIVLSLVISLSSAKKEYDDLEDFSEDIPDTIATSQALISSRDLTAIAGSCSLLCVHLH